MVIQFVPCRSIISTLWNSLLEINYEVPLSRLPQLDSGAKRVIEDAESTMGSGFSKNQSPAEGMIAAYRAACDYTNVRRRACVERYIAERLNEIGPYDSGDNSVRVFDLGTACRDEAAGGKFSDADFPALSRALSVTTHFDAIALVGNAIKRFASADQRSSQATVSGDAARALLSAIDSAPLIRRVLLVGVGLRADKLDKLEAAFCFRRITHWNINNNPGLGTKGLAKLLGDNQSGPERLERLECTNCGIVRTLPLRPTWSTTLRYIDATRCDLSKSVDSLNDWLTGARVLEVILFKHCGINVLSTVDALAKNEVLTEAGVLRVLDISLNKCVDDLKGCRPLTLLTQKATRLERLALAEVSLSLAALDALLIGLNTRAKSVLSKSATEPALDSVDADSKQAQAAAALVPLVLFIPDNAMEKKHGAVFFERLSAQVPSRICAPIQALNLDRSHLGTLGLRDLFAALASSGAPYLKSLSLKSTASKGGMFANKRKHEEMAKALADVIRCCTALERLYLTGGDGSYFKGDLLPALFELQSNKTLLVLDISNNQCGDDAIQALADALSLNETLRALYFDCNLASANTIKHIAKELDRNHTLYDVSLPVRDSAAAVRNLASDAERVALNKALKDMKAIVERNLQLARVERHAQSVPENESAPFGKPQCRSVRSGFEAFFSMSNQTERAYDLEDAIAGTADDAGTDESVDVDVENDLDPEADYVASELTNHAKPGSEPAKLTDAEDEPTAGGDLATKEKDSNQKVSGSASVLKPKGGGDVAHRMKIFQEILESETTYVRDLGVICQNFLAPIEKHELLKRDEIKEVFGNIRELREIHVTLLGKLRDADRRHRDVRNTGKANAEADAAAELASTHARIFSEMIPFLQAYAAYCGTYTAAIQLVKTLSEGRPNSKLSNFLQKMMVQCRGLDLPSYLIKPPQRLCKYPLFFNDLLKHMGDSPADAASAELIAATLKSVQNVANAVNKTMAASGSMGKVYEIFKENLDSHVTDLVDPARRFLVEGDVDFASPDKAPKRHHFYLFNDLMLLCTPRRSLVSGSDIPGKYKVKHRFALVDFDVVDPPPALALNANDYFFRMRFKDRNGGTESFHWPADGTRPPETDFLIWTDKAVRK